MISVIIPVYNEEQIVAETVERLRVYLGQVGLDHEIIIASNGSTDRTVEIVRGLLLDRDWLHLIELPEKTVGGAFVRGVRQAKGDVIVSVDADLSSNLSFIAYACELLKYGEMVVGSKTIGTQRRTAVRVIGSQVYILFSYMLFDLNVSDYSMGCKVYNKSAIEPCLDHLDAGTGYVFDVVLYLKTHGMKVVQVSVDCDDRRASRFNLFQEAFHRYRHLFRRWRHLKSHPFWSARE